MRLNQNVNHIGQADVGNYLHTKLNDKEPTITVICSEGTITLLIYEAVKMAGDIGEKFAEYCREMKY